MKFDLLKLELRNELDVELGIESVSYMKQTFVEIVSVSCQFSQHFFKTTDSISVDPFR